MVAEHPGVDRIHLLELRNVQQKHPAPQYVLKIAAGRLKNRLQVPEHLFRLRFDVWTRKLAGGGIGGALSRNEYETIEPHAR